MRGRRCNKQHFNAESTFYNYSWRARISQIFLPPREFFSNAQGIMHTWLIFSGCIPTRSMSTLYIRDISVNKSKQSVWTRRGNISAHYNAGAGARVRRWSGVSPPPAPVPSCIELRPCPRVHLIWLQCSSGQQCTQLWPALLQLHHQEHSLSSGAEIRRDKLYGCFFFVLHTFCWYGSRNCRNRIVDIFFGVFYLVCPSSALFALFSLV